MKDEKIKEKKKIKELKNQVKENLDGWMRSQADYENLKKEMIIQKEDWIKFANTNLIIEILPVLDNFKASTNHVPESEKTSPWVQGIMYIQKQLQDILNSQGVEEIKTVGEKFDPELHDAVEDKTIKKSKEHKKGHIIKEVKPGYILHGKVISPARVVVG
ncbi:nucleotide exchange factor GrpE [Candidatus Falkowbacteria bacterium]|jgi:molecular chaperone GrpE|nr:nucleotide exchange factor GrpE [Candidatus Falkowbacteria bacterium]MBT4432882.1 nucleotide exchange factor GrpE [Candidatus Falkowbacteria bacterium]